MTLTAEGNRIDEIRAWKGKRVIEMAGRRRSCLFPFRLPSSVSSRAFEQLPKLWRKDRRADIRFRCKKKERRKKEKNRTRGNEEETYQLLRSRFPFTVEDSCTEATLDSTLINCSLFSEHPTAAICPAEWVMPPETRFNRPDDGGAVHVRASIGNKYLDGRSAFAFARSSFICDIKTIIHCVPRNFRGGTRNRASRDSRMWDAVARAKWPTKIE